MKETEFKEFPKMARLSRKMIITEKIDGTNAQILITNISLEEGKMDVDTFVPADNFVIATHNGYTIRAGSRNGWILPGKKTDNMGFAGWVHDNAQELIEKLGEGRHFGEWWGSGIQRGYEMKEKVFSLFNVERWAGELCPPCCRVVPELYRGPFDTVTANNVLQELKKNGSYAAPGFMRPEGIIVWHVAGNFGLKKTIEKDELPKSLTHETL